MSERMLFCLGDGKFEGKGDGYQKNYMVFNTKVTEKEYDDILSSLSGIKLSGTHWIEEDDMTKEEKDDHDDYKTLGGYLKYVSYEDMWKNWWEEASQKDKDLILDIPQFDTKIFKGITGIDVSRDDKKDKKKKELLKKVDELIKKADKLKVEADNL